LGAREQKYGLQEPKYDHVQFCEPNARFKVQRGEDHQNRSKLDGERTRMIGKHLLLKNSEKI
jgi:hypothetical protein